MKTLILSAIFLLPIHHAHAQELLAWPMGAQNIFRALLPGMPLRPILPPRPLPPRPMPQPAPTMPDVLPPASSPLKISDYRVEGNITDTIAELTYTVSFNNPSPRRMEGVLVMPIPADTVLSGFTMTVGGKEMKAELLPADQASTIYQTIVRQMRDPGLLELIGERMIRARVFPIEPHSSIVVKMKVNQILKKSGNLYALNIPMRTATMSGATATGASVQLNLSSSKPLRTLYSPLHEAEIKRNGTRKASITYNTKETALRDLSLFYSLEEDSLAASLLHFKQEGEDGFFLLSLSPQRNTADEEIVPKDIVFIVDRSGSMAEGGKIEQAKKALRYCVSKLRPQDRFGIVDFATDTNMLEKKLVWATSANKAQARRYIDRIEAAGGTNIETALNDGLAIIPRHKGRVPMTFFLTDGLPTVGKTNMETLLRDAQNKNKDLHSRVFTFGVGDDVNTLFLDKLAEMNRGDRDYVRSGETIEGKVSALYKKLDRPALTDVRIEWEGVSAAHVYPRPITDLFYGSEIVLLGRYREHGKGNLIIRGRAGKKELVFKYPVTFPKKEKKNDFIPRLWANMKVTHELDALRLAGSGAKDPEVIESIVRLAKRYGIITPYTSYLITEEGFDMPRARREADVRLNRMRQDAARSGRQSSPLVAARAQEDSFFFSAMAGKGASSAAANTRNFMAEAEENARIGLKKAGHRAISTRRIGEKTFYLRHGVWTDGEYDSKRDTSPAEIHLRYMSEAYFRHIEKMPELARYFSIGSNAVILFNGQVYRITD